MKKEYILVMIKPGSVCNRFAGEIITRYEKAGFYLEKMELDSFSRSIIKELYKEHERKEFYKKFKEDNITKILTIEASGIAIATVTALYFNVPVVFAKKTESLNLDEDVYTHKVFSYTKDKYYDIKVSKKYLHKNDNILIIDDFLARGQAALGLYDIVKQSNANLKGIGIVVEKGFQDGRKLLLEKGIKLESLAVVRKIHEGKITF